MNNFLIGMYGKFDNFKYKRDLRPGFWGVEACLFPDEHEVDRLVSRTIEDGFNFGVHYPLIKKDTPYESDFLYNLFFLLQAATLCLNKKKFFFCQLISDKHCGHSTTRTWSFPFYTGDSC
jgi:hypothetical protein